MAVAWPVIRSTRVSALIWALVRSSPVAFAVSAAARSDAKQATACSTGSTAVILAIVSGNGRMDTYRSSRARAARRTAASWSSSITRRRTAWLISGTDIDPTTGPSSASTRPRSSRVRHRVSRDRRPHPTLGHPARRESAQRGGHLRHQRPGIRQPARRRRRGTLGGEADLIRDPQPPPPHRHTLRLLHPKLRGLELNRFQRLARPPTRTAPEPATRSDRSAPRSSSAGVRTTAAAASIRSPIDARNTAPSVPPSIVFMCSILIVITDNSRLPTRAHRSRPAWWSRHDQAATPHHASCHKRVGRTSLRARQLSCLCSRSDPTPTRTPTPGCPAVRCRGL